ncbi:MAG: hypothetical protein ACUVRD_07345 [Bacteroidia bacterium]
MYEKNSEPSKSYLRRYQRIAQELHIPSELKPIPISQIIKRNGNLYQACVEVYQQAQKIYKELHDEISDSLKHLDEEVPTYLSLDEQVSMRLQQYEHLSRQYAQLPKPNQLALYMYLHQGND